jgi:hypothetical protein
VKKVLAFVSKMRGALSFDRQDSFIPADGRPKKPAKIRKDQKSQKKEWMEDD